jgi:hypothetical protein
VTDRTTDDFHAFGLGVDYLRSHGLPALSWFLLSTKPVSEFSVDDTLAGGVGEITGTGYERQPQASPGWSAPWLGREVFADFGMLTWTTGAATDWPEEVRSVVLATSPDDSGVALVAWNLQAGGWPRNLAKEFVTQWFTPTITADPQQMTTEKAG